MFFKLFLISCLNSFLRAGDVIDFPQNSLSGTGLPTSFLAKFCLFFGIILIFTVFFAKILKFLFKIPIVAGQIISGIVLGPSLIKISNWEIFNEKLILFGSNYSFFYSDIFLFFILLISGAFTVTYLLWLAGYETNLSEMYKVGTASALAGFLGAVVPICLTILGVFLTLGFTCSMATAIGVGIIFSATSVSIPVAVLVSQKKMHLRSSKATLGAAIIDDILAVVILSIFVVMLQSGFLGECTFLNKSLHTSTISESIFKIVIAFVSFFLFGLIVIPFVMNFFNKRRVISLIAPTAFFFMLFYFSFSEIIGGLAGITGAYFAGVFQRRVDEHHYSESIISPFLSAIFVPIFLASVGLQLDITTLSLYDWFIAIILFFVAVLSKFVGVYLATFLSNIFFESQRWSCIETFIFGASMVARGEVGLVVATFLKNLGVITPSVYLISVVVIVLTTIITPVLLSVGFSLEKKPDESYEIKIVNLGQFDTLGTKNMFESILEILEKDKFYGTYLQLSDGHVVVDFQKNKLDILFKPEEGIVIKGEKAYVLKILSLISNELNHDLDKVKKAIQALH